MSKFWIIFKKETKAWLTVGSIISLVFIFVAFSLLGNFIGGMIDGDSIIIEVGDSDDYAGHDIGHAHHTNEIIVSAAMVVGLIDHDNSQLSNMVREALASWNRLATPASNDPTEAMIELENYVFYGEEIRVGSLIVINRGFESTIRAGHHAMVDIHTAIDSFGGIGGMAGMGAHGALSIVNSVVSQYLLAETAADVDLWFATNPVFAQEYTFLNNHSEPVSASMVHGYVSGQLVFVPIVAFMIITTAASLLAMSMVNEKADKTLETLMTAPINRMSVLAAKILSSAIYSAIYALVFVFAYGNFMETLGGGGNMPYGFIEAVENFGITFNVITYLVIGVQLFLSVLCGLAIALIIGMMVDDVQTLQRYMMPLTVVMLVPYILTLILDVNTLPLIAQIGVYLIPFAHTFTAAANLFMQNYTLIAIGLVYQTVFVIIMLSIAVRIFNSDKLFTLGQMFSSKTKNISRKFSKPKKIG